MSNAELNDSHLGDKSHWDDIYVSELKNYQSHADVGEIWFGERTECKIVQWCCDHVSAESKVVDIGTGNGHLLTELYEEGFHNLTGIDYSQSAVKLASEIASSEGKDIRFCTQNILEDEPSQQFDLCLDKGTYDAISLSATSAEDRVRYKAGVKKLLADGGYFLLASVNWTVSELREWFSDIMSVHCVLPCKQFTYGGQTGQDVSIIVFSHL